MASSSIRRASAQTDFAARIPSVSTGQSVFQPRRPVAVPITEPRESRRHSQVQTLSPLQPSKGLLTREKHWSEALCIAWANAISVQSPKPPIRSTDDHGPLTPAGPSELFMISTPKRSGEPGKEVVPGLVEVEVAVPRLTPALR